MEPVSLTRLNDFSEAYAAFDFEKGTMEVADSSLRQETASSVGKVSNRSWDDMSVR